MFSIIVAQVQPLFLKAEAKNKLLRSVAGGGVDSLSSLQAFWDKFELMMESHQLMVKEQVSWPNIQERAYIRPCLLLNTTLAFLYVHTFNQAENLII